MSDRLARAISAIDALHAGDPQHENGVPAELLYAQRMSAALASLAPAPSEALQIAVRAQHLCRWKLPRAAHPATKAGYLRWRTAQAKLHAELAGETLRAAGYDEPFVERVGDLIRKKNRARDPDAQALEDAACLVFVEHHLEPFARGRDQAQLGDIVRKTWDKMSERGRKAALALPLSEAARGLVERALAGDNREPAA